MVSFALPLMGRTLIIDCLESFDCTVVSWAVAYVTISAKLGLLLCESAHSST